MAVETIKLKLQFAKMIMKKNSWFVAIILFVSSCLVPTSKESYLENFEKFIETVEKEHENYNEKDWKWTDKQFENFSEEWYDEFSNEMTLKEKLKVKMLILKYQAIRGEEELDAGIRKFLREDTKELKEEIEEYIENDAEEDLQKIREGMEEIGDSAVKVFEDIVRSLRKKQE